MDKETRLALIHIAESCADALRNDTFSLTDEDGQAIIRFAHKVVNPSPVEGSCTMTQACHILGVTEPTLRKYIKLGIVPAGYKVPNIQGKFWNEQKLRSIAKDFRRDRKKYMHK